MRPSVLWLSLFLATWIAVACAPTRPEPEEAAPVVSSTYDTEFPGSGGAEQLEHVVDVTKKIFSQAHYKTWYFSFDSRMTAADLSKEAFKSASEIARQQHSVAGSGTVIWKGDTRLALLSCAHIFDWQDTLYTFHLDAEMNRTERLASVSILERQSNFVQDIPHVSNLDVLLLDEEMDLALLGAEIPREWSATVPALRVPLGTSRDLRWGAFVYVAGFPGGYHMITKALVSRAEGDRRYSFLIDAPFNVGLSGGLVLAQRGSPSSLEVVGIVTSAASLHETVLSPPPDSAIVLDAPYRGTIWAENRTYGRQGITFVSGAERVAELIRRHEHELRASGYDLYQVLP
jgi:hypothetical protein